MAQRHLPEKTATIALVVPSFDDTGGIITVAEFMLRALRRRPDFDVRLISLATSSRDPCSVLLSRPSTWLRGVQTRSGRAHGEDFVHVGALGGELEFRRLAKRSELTRLLADCDLINILAGAPAWACPVLGLGKPVVLQVATLTGIERRKRANEERGFLGLWRQAMTGVSRRLDDHALKRADAVMVFNPWMLAHATSLAGPNGAIVRYAPPGVDARMFHPLSDGADAEPYILAVGRFADKRKNATLLLKAYARLRSLVADAPSLLLAGADAPDQAFWDTAETLGLGRFVSFRAHPSNQELSELYRRAVSFVLPSDEEGFGMVVVEAMASGLPVVATRCGGPDGIITDGVDGYLVARDSVEEMADRLARIVQDPGNAREVGRNARRTVEDRYADELAGQAYLDVFDELLAR